MYCGYTSQSNLGYAMASSTLDSFWFSSSSKAWEAIRAWFALPDIIASYIALCSSKPAWPPSAEWSDKLLEDCRENGYQTRYKIGYPSMKNPFELEQRWSFDLSTLHNQIPFAAMVIFWKKNRKLFALLYRSVGCRKRTASGSIYIFLNPKSGRWRKLWCLLNSLESIQ